jgi:hypothetical protein
MEETGVTATETFLEGFFGTGNTVWPDRDPYSPVGRRLLPLFRPLYEPGDVPVVLPRRRPGRSDAPPSPLLAYVIAWNATHATAVAELLSAFVGPSYTWFDGRPAQLDGEDPVDRAVLDLVGPGCAFVLASPTQQTSTQAWKALELLQEAVARRPARTWTIPKPIGRLLAEFELALAAGDAATSAAVLDQLRVGGGLSGLNFAHLQVKRLSRLGRDDELLRLAELGDVVAARPPMPVVDAVLAAIYQTALAEALTAGDLRLATDRLLERGHLVPALLDTALEDGATLLGAEARAVLCVAAWIRRDTRALARLLKTPSDREQLGRLSPALVAEVVQDLERAADSARVGAPAGRTPAGDNRGGSERELAAVGVAALREPAEPPTPLRSWRDWVRATIADAPEAEWPHPSEEWRTWDAPATGDDDLAALMAAADDDGASRLWSLVGAFVDADAYQRPAASSAREFIRNALTYGRFGPADLAGLVALTELVLRAAPSAEAYAELLDDLRAECDRWVGAERANVALDLADLLVRAACPDNEARLRLALALLHPLHTHQGRLDPSEAVFARQLSSELATGLVWAAPTGDEAAAVPSTPPAPVTVLLYSLDQAVLARVTDALAELAPGSKVHQSHDHVGTDQLKQWARNAQAIALATRCAKHAATGFIRANARPDATIAEADGSGSASLLLAAMSALRWREGKKESSPSLR